jgi:hypothetical protein
MAEQRDRLQATAGISGKDHVANSLDHIVYTPSCLV